MLLAGSAEPEVRDGRGVVLAYPLAQADVELETAGNDHHTAQLVYELLQALYADPAYGQSPPPLPVPSRAPIEAALRARGYEIEGDTAMRRKPGLLGAFRKERVPLPAEARVEELLRLGAAALRKLGGWPSPRALALRGRVPLEAAAWLEGQDHGLRVVGDPPMYKAELTLALAKNLTRQVGFVVDEGFTHAGPAELELEHSGDPGTLEIGVVYPSGNGQSRIEISRTVEYGYQVTQVPIRDLQLAADTQLVLELTGEGNLWIKRVALRPGAVKSGSPAPDRSRDPPPKARPQGGRRSKRR
jgi:hypothetical protein